MKTIYAVAVASCCMGINAAHESRADGNPISLFDRDSLTGWTYGEEPPRGWRMEDGVLHGEQNATSLLSGWSWGEVELTFRWKVKGDAQWRLRLRRIPSGDRIVDVILGEVTPTSAAIVTDSDDGIKMVLSPSSDGWHTAQLTSRDGLLSVKAKSGPKKDNPIFSEGGSITKIETGDSRFTVDLALLNGAGALRGFKAIEPQGKPLYNGKDLTGWWTPGNLDSWKPEGEAIVCVNKKGNYLRTEREYANFTLSLDYKMAKGGNSGIGIRTARNGWPSGDGMELQMLDERPGKPITRHSTMAIYGNLEPLARADRSQEWNHVVIKAEGYLLSAWVNGVLVQHANTAELPELRRRNLAGWIGLQDHGARTEFRNLSVLEAPDGLGLRAWRTPPAPSGSQIVLERLMNPERLATDDGLGSGAITASVQGKAAQNLAELMGPGAVVVVSRTNPSGRLTFYFDGEVEPRLECPADKLHMHLPLVGQDTQPLLTYLPYRKSLKVAIDGGRPGEYRLDYVTFPDSVRVEQFAEDKACVARGLLPASSYRNEQLGWGTHREADPLPRAGTEGQKIDEQSQATLVDLKGPGIVEWTKLIAAPSLLSDDELWLEVTLDEEASAAIRVPARYFFPGLAGGNYPNYVVLNRNGWTNMLAMPFRKRLTMALANRGRRPVQPIGLTVSYQPLDDANDPRLARRLRGVFTSDARGSDQHCWAEQSGGGRFIGLVTQYGAADAGIDSLLLDGEPKPGWHSPDGRTFWGLEPTIANERRSLCGRQGGFQWRFFLLAPPEFRKSFELRAAAGPPLGDRLALFYMNAPDRR